MVALGISPDKIFVCGMTLSHRQGIGVNSVKQKLGIADNDKVVLVGSGSLGTGIDEMWLKYLIKQLSLVTLSPKVIVVCGKNINLFNRLKKSFETGQNVIVLGYYKPIAELYAISHIFLSKPGGLTIAEALQWELPVIVTHCLHGQEELNYSYLVKKHLVMNKSFLVEPKILVKIIEEEISSGKFKTSLVSNPERLSLVSGNESESKAVHVINFMFHTFDSLKERL